MQTVSQTFFVGRTHGTGQDFPGVKYCGPLGKVVSDTVGINAGAVKLGKFEQAIKRLFHLVIGPVEKLDAKAIDNGAANFLPDVDDAEMLLTANVHAQKEAGLRIGG